MAKSTKGVTDRKVLAPEDMTEEQLREYVASLEQALTQANQSNAAVTAKKQEDWLPGQRRWVMIPKTPTNDVITINGKPYIGRMLLDLDTWQTVQEVHNKAIRSELARMQSRGNLVPAHLLASDDVSSRTQPVTIANL